MTNARMTCHWTCHWTRSDSDRACSGCTSGPFLWTDYRPSTPTLHQSWRLELVWYKSAGARHGHFANSQTFSISFRIFYLWIEYYVTICDDHYMCNITIYMCHNIHGGPLVSESNYLFNNLRKRLYQSFVFQSLHSNKVHILNILQ